MIVPFKKDPIEFKQRAIFATNVFDLLTADHPCYVYGTYLSNLTHQVLRRNTAFVVKMRIIQG